MSEAGFRWNPALKEKEVLDYLSIQQHSDLKKFSFKPSPFEKVSRQELVQQIEGRLRSRKKLPPWYQNNQVLFPALLNLEQCSSWTTAQYKAELIASLLKSKESLVLDITGGFGVDSFAFCSTAQKVHYCEQNKDLASLVAYNSQAFQLQNIKVFGQTAEMHLQSSKAYYDLIYADPSRRNEKTERVFAIEDTEPNLKELLPLITNRSKFLLVKTSPYLDLQQGLEAFPNTKDLHIVAVGKDVKELLWSIPSESSGSTTRIHCSHFRAGQWKNNTFTLDEKQKSRSQTGFMNAYLFLPNPALMKAGAFQWIGEHFGLLKLSPNSHVYTQENKIDFPGKTFRILKTFSPGSKNLKSYRNKPYEVVTRNYPLSVEQLRKKFNLLPGGEPHYLIFTRDAENKAMTIEAELLLD